MNLKRPLISIAMFYFATVLQAKPATFNVRVINDGSVFDEYVGIDVAKQTVTFHMPYHEGFDEADVVHDFRKKLTTISLPEKQVCFVSQLSDNLPLPEELMNSFKKAATAGADSNFQWVKSAMETKELIEDRSTLEYVTRDMCRNFPIYRIQPLKDSIYITPISRKGEMQGRVSRSTCSSSVCYTVYQCYWRCPSPTCYECTEERICDQIDC